MKLIINNIKQLGKRSDMITERLRAYLEQRAAQANLAFGSFQYKKDLADGVKGITISHNDKDKKFVYSNRLNFIPLKPGDKRITETGKNYLQSRRLTEQQYAELLKMFSVYLEYIGVECDVYIQEFDDDNGSMIPIRKGKETLVKEWLKPNNFTQEKL